MVKAKRSVNMTEGPIFGKMLLFVLPIMATGMLQIFYNMADHIVVGQFSGDELALAAVGSTSSLTNLIVNFLMGIAAGAGVVVAQSYGAKQNQLLSRTVHTSVLFSLVGGVFFCIIGFFVSKPALILIGTKPELLEKAALYMRIIFLGVPASAVYNFCASILRSVGDSKTPLVILSCSGIVNVILNLFFVIVCNMSVDGVALATIISQYICAACVVIVLNRRKNECYGLSFSKIGIDIKVLERVLRYGVPAGIQSSLFSVSNVILTSAINTLSTETISAKTIAGNVDATIYTALNSYSVAGTTFAGQNFGAGKTERIKRIALCSALQIALVGLTLSSLILIFREPLCIMFLDKSAESYSMVLSIATELLTVMVPSYFLCGIMDNLAGILRGLGYSLFPMFVNIIGICGLRILWVYTVFPIEAMHNLIGLYIVYPVSWTATLLAHLSLLIFALMKFSKERKIRANI